MELSEKLREISRLEKVVDRLAARGPSGVSAPHCWFCGKNEAWFLCDCKDAVLAREGKREKPRWVERGGKSYIILDPDVIAREHNQTRKRAPVNTEPVHGAGIAVHAADDDNTAAKRKAYRAEWMRRKRDRAAKDGTP